MPHSNNIPTRCPHLTHTSVRPGTKRFSAPVSFPCGGGFTQCVHIPFSVQAAIIVQRAAEAVHKGEKSPKTAARDAARQLALAKLFHTTIIR